MGYLARLDDGVVIAPAVEVLSGDLTPLQANSTYKGTTGMCPHCEAMRDAQAGTDNLSIQTALSMADLTVHYVSAQIREQRMKRIMHFAHRRGFLRTDGACLLCRSADLAHHAAVVQVIGGWCRRHWQGSKVEAEMTVVLPGTPPQQFRPDVSVHDATGRPLACVEYQRTPEKYEDFVRRHELRRRQFPRVVWFFARGAYHRSADHRSYLDDRDHDFYSCWVDERTGQLQYKDGERPAARRQSRVEHKVEKCSEASLIRAMEDRATGGGSSAPAPVDTTLPLLKVSVDGRGSNPPPRVFTTPQLPSSVIAPARRTVPTSSGIKTVTEHQRVEAESLAWQPVEVVELSREREMVLGLSVGDRIRRSHGAGVETYRGRSGAGYETSAGIHASLRGWLVHRPDEPAT